MAESAVDLLQEPISTEHRRLLASANGVFPGGVLGTFVLGIPDPPVIVSANGSRLRDVNGNTYVDYVLGAGPLIVGHAHPVVVDRMKRQAEAGTTYYLLNEPAIQLAEEVLSVLPESWKIKFTSSGSEATFYALRLARAWTGRSQVVKFAGAYHGHNDYAMAEAFAREWTREEPVQWASSGIPAGVAESVIVLPYNDTAALAELIESRGESIAAVLIEPYQRVLEPDREFVQALNELSSRYGILLIADEVVSGFRFHYGTASSLYGLRADLVALGKIIGGGLPLAAVAGVPQVMELANPDRSTEDDYVYFSGTLNGHALAAAAGLATLEVLRRDDAYQRLSHVGERLRTSLQHALSDAGSDGEVLGRGPMFHVVHGVGPFRNAWDLARADWARTRALYRRMIGLGVMMNPSQRAYISLAHSDADVAYTEEAFRRALR